MDWSFDFSRQADKFLRQQRVADAVVIEVVGRALQKLDGEAVAVDLERLTDPWKGYYRVRMQKTRIIFSFDAHARSVYIAVIDYRDSVYRKRR
jgi:mRNA-degrading endonuclease RelE of RelBE toxin-antitoxin system